MVNLVPVDHDPFAAPQSTPKFTEVDYDPFAAKDVTQNPTEQLAPASGVFPAVTRSDVAARIDPVQPTYAPPPTVSPVAATDPGVLAESYGDAVKGLHATKRGAFLTGYMANMYGDVDNIAKHLAASQEIEKQYPQSEATAKAAEELSKLSDSGASGILPALGVYTRNPRLAASTAIQSLPSMLGPLVTVPVGAAVGSLAGPVGTATGAFVGLGVGSASADFGSAFEDYARGKWNPQTEADWKAILLDPAKYREAGNYAAAHAGMVGAFDALGGKIGGKVGMAVAGRAAEAGLGKLARVGVAAAPAIGTDATIGALGEASGQLAGTGVTEGTPRINDPGGVAGEFAAGVVTGGATSSVEPIIHHFNVGGAPATPVKAEDVIAANTAMQTPKPEDVSGSFSQSATGPTFYSPLRKYVEEKGPGAASADQWANTIRNAPGVKEEEVRDIGLHDYFADNPRKISKAELLGFLDENAIQVNETTRVNEPDDMTNGGWTNIGGRGARYEEYTLPGERQGYTELTLHVPTMNIEVNPETPTTEIRHDPESDPEFPWQILIDGKEVNRSRTEDTAPGILNEELERHMSRAKREANTQRDYVGGHYAEPNVVAHARITERTDNNGTPLALIEEIQSDWHQAGRKQGYAKPNPRLGAGELVNAEHGKYRFVDQTGKEHFGWGKTEAEAKEAALQFAAGNSAGLPDGPFKQSWDELAFRRMLRWAADKGYRRVAWVNAAEQSRRYPGSEARDAGMVQFYDKNIPSIAKRWAKRLGGTLGETQLGTDPAQLAALEQQRLALLDEAKTLSPSNPRYGEIYTQLPTISTQIRDLYQQGSQTVQHIDLPQAAVDLIQRGLPLYSEQAEPKPGATIRGPMTNAEIQKMGPPMVEALQALIKKFNLGVEVNVIFHDNAIRYQQADGRTKVVANALGMAMFKAKPEIHISVARHTNPAEIWGTLTHELGHIIERTIYAKADTSVKTSIRAAYDEWRAKYGQTRNLAEIIARRDNAMIAYFNTRNVQPNSEINSPQKRQYWVGFEEWFAEQVARWATSQEKPLSTVEQFFSKLGKLMRAVFAEASKLAGYNFEPAKAMNDWLNSFHTESQPFAEDINTQNDVHTTADNQRHMGEGEKATEQQPETVVARDVVRDIFNGRPPKEVQQTLAYADKFNKIYKWALGIHQVAQRNGHIVPLQEYTETIAVAQLTKQQVMIRAQEVLKKWNRLGGKQADAVAALIDSVNNLEFLTPDEVKQGVVRFPTSPELAALVKKHGVTQEGLAVFKEVATTFQEHLTRYEAVLRNEANKIVNAQERADRNDAITLQIRALRTKPYFPAMRFGNYTITVRDAGGKVIHFETFERERKRNRAAEEIRQKYNVGKDQMELGMLDPQVRPMMGVPTQLLEQMAAKLQLSPKQRDALDQLKFELSPAQSFKHRFQHKNRIAGYSQDFRRAYANYFFHGANHLMRAMYADRLRELAKATKEEVRGVYDVTTRHEIVGYMNDHLENWLDPKSDWAAVRSIAFLWSLAWTPAAAAQNLTQTLMTTYPFLAQQFGDFGAVRALTKTGADFQTWLTKGKLQNATDFELRAIARGISDGIINEAMAPELAGFAEGRTLGMGFGGNELQRGITKFNEWGAKMFELAEQTNRRLVFRAALKLAQEQPGAQYVKDMPEKHRLHYDQLRKEGWTEGEATAYVVARDATITTQFQYGREYAPRMMRGKLRSIFVFKTFIQNYVLFLANYPHAAVRSLLILGALGGLMGVPGAEDLKEILKAIAWRMFGKDFDLEQEARRAIIQMAGEDENGRQIADLALHGIARQGYGIPAFMDMLGGTVGIDIPMPTFDRSAAISAGTLLPIELGKLFGPPTQDTDAVIAGQAQKASGAVFGAGFNVYKALVNSKLNWSDSKRWERAVPRALGSVAKAYRVGTEGKERSGTGSTVVSYDVRDTEQLMEVLGMAAGYTPYRQSLQWNRIMAGQEAVKLWDIRRQGLMKQMGNAALGKDEKEIARVRDAIKKFNADLPEEARGKAITSDAMRASVETQGRNRRAQEMELSTKRSDIPILREVQKLYPESKASNVRKVKGTP